MHSWSLGTLVLYRAQREVDHHTEEYYFMYCCIIFLQQYSQNLGTKKNYKSLPQTLIIISISLQPADLYLWYFKCTLTYVKE